MSKYDDESLATARLMFIKELAEQRDLLQARVKELEAQKNTKQFALELTRAENARLRNALEDVRAALGSPVDYNAAIAYIELALDEDK